MSTIVTLIDLFHDQLRDIYSMEVQLCEELPHLVSLCTDESLRELLLQHAHQNCNQVSEIAALFERRGESPAYDKCKAMAGLIEGGRAHLAKVDSPQIRDLMMIAHCLRIGYYEMAAYEITTLISGKLGLVGDSVILSEFLVEKREMAAGLLQIDPGIFHKEPAIS